MGKLSLAVATFAAAMWLGTHPSQAYYGNAPWCAIVSVGLDTVVEQCTFANLDSCRQEVIAGNRGFCTNNPRLPAYLAATPAKPRLARKRVRH